MMNVRLRQFDYKKDLDKLYHYMMAEDEQKLLSHKFQIHNAVMFEHWLNSKFANNEYHDFFMIENDAAVTIGFTFSYEFFGFDGHCKYTLCLFEEYRSKGYGAVAAVKMIDYLFRNYPLHRVYTSVFSYNRDSLLVNKKGGFEEVGVLPGYRYWGGEYFSLHILTITRLSFYDKHRRILKRVNSQHS